MSTANEQQHQTGEICKANVDLNGLMDVLSKHLYSTPMVALRELVQNAHDSIIRRRIEQPDWSAVTRIDIITDVAQGCLRIIDTGAGLTEQEIHAYLATVGVGYTRVLREKKADNHLIGMFGLGFLSAFVLAEQVIVNTTSWQTPQLGHCYRSKNGERYSVTPCPAREVGTEVVLILRQEFSGLLSTGLIQEVLERYCSLLSEPIYINHHETAINAIQPPWRNGDNTVLHPIQQQRQNLEFAARFENYFEPLCTLPVTPTGESDALGLLWVQDGKTYGTSDNRNLSVFIRGMLLDDDARDLLPVWAGFIGGVIESTALTPTASRESLQRDEQYAHVTYALSEALIEGLSRIAYRQHDVWRRILFRHNEALLGAALCDDRLFQLMVDCVQIPTSQGEMKVERLINGGRVYVILDNDNSFEEMLFRALQVPVAYGYRYAVVPFLRRWAKLKNIQLIELGTEQGNDKLFQQHPVSNEQFQWLMEHLVDNETLITAYFQPVILPLVVVPDRDAQLKKRLDEDFQDKRISLSALHLARQFTKTIDDSTLHRLYLNLNNSAVQHLLAALTTNDPGCDAIADLLRTFKLLSASQVSQTEDSAQQLQQALNHLNQLAEKLLSSHKNNK